MDKDALRRQAAEKAVEFIRPGMVVGLGTGKTASHAVHFLADRLQDGTLYDITSVPTSQTTAHEAQARGIPLGTLHDHPEIALTIDGADEVNPDGDVIKGGGGALLWEKLVAQSSKREVIIVDTGKLSDALGINWPVPVEVVAFAWQQQQRFLESLGADAPLRYTDDDEVFVTDGGNYILDADFGRIDEPHELADRIKARTGVVDHGLFIDIVTDLIIASDEGVTHRAIRQPHG